MEAFFGVADIVVFTGEHTYEIIGMVMGVVLACALVYFQDSNPGLLTTSLGIGLYFAVTDRKSSSDVYFFGGRDLPPVAVGLSISVTIASAILMIGFPAEVYAYGTVYFWMLLGDSLSAFIAILYYIPIFHRLNLKTVYEYLEIRFNTATRRLCSVSMIICQVLYMGTTLYIPSLALSAITPIPLYWSIVLTGSLCTIYTSLGGFKAVIWTDILQGTLMIVGLLSIFIRGTILSGGLDEIWKAVKEGGRINAFDCSPSLTKRATPWSVTIGSSMTCTFLFCFSQPMIQRYQSCRTIRNARLAIVSGLVMLLILILLTLGNGMLLYTYFQDCDPVMSGKIRSRDQAIPYMALQIFQNLPGMTGLIVAAVYSGTLSTVSSGINSLSIMCVEDIVPIWYRSIEPWAKLLVGKIFAFEWGILVMGIAFLVSTLEGGIVKIAMGIQGAIGGPLLGLYTLGLFVPCANAVGALVGTCASSVIMLWILIGSAVTETVYDTGKLPLPLSRCNHLLLKNQSMIVMDAKSNLTEVSDGFDKEVYKLTFFYYGLLGFALCTIFGIVVSFITGARSGGEADSRLFVPIVDSRYAPKMIRKLFRCGVPEHTADEQFQRENMGQVPMDMVVTRKLLQ